MSSNVKLRLKAAIREIEIEASSAEIDRLLEKWWTSDQKSNPDEEVAEERAEGTNDQSKRSQKPRKKTGRQRHAMPAEASIATGEAFDANAFANDVKASNKFAKIQGKVIVGSATNFNKIAFVHWFAKRPLTSGDVQKALASLGVKLALPRISEA